VLFSIWKCCSVPVSNLVTGIPCRLFSKQNEKIICDDIYLQYNNSTQLLHWDHVSRQKFNASKSIKLDTIHRIRLGKQSTALLNEIANNANEKACVTITGNE
jgi:hypothetical protein